MKTLIFIITSLISFQTWAQVGLDYMGVPTDNNSGVVFNSNITKSMNAQFIPVQMAFPSPCAIPTSIAHYDNLLWVTGYNEFVVYKVSPINGAVVGTIPVAIQKPYGITFNDNKMYIIDNISKHIIEYTMSGIVIDTIELSNVNNPLYVTGLCFADEEFWFNDTKGPNPSAVNDSIFGLSSQLQLNHGFESVGAFPSGISYNGKYLWVNDNPSQTSNLIDPITHVVLKSIQLPGGAYPNGVACDGSGLWIINNGSDSIYYLMPDGATNIANNDLNTNGMKIFSTDNQIIFNYNSEWVGGEVVLFDCTSRIIGKKFIPAGNEFIWNNDFSELITGIYFVSVYNKESKLTEKLFLSHN